MRPPKLSDLVKQRDHPAVWALASDMTDNAMSAPERIWDDVLEATRHADEEASQAIGCCIIEHILECHFDVFFPRIAAEIAGGNRGLHEALSVSWKLGQSCKAQNSAAWDDLVKRGPR